MHNRRTLVFLAVLCAMIVPALGAACASAKGTTYFTCAKTGTTTKIGEFANGDCQAEAPGEFHHFEVAPGTVTELQTTVITPLVIHSTPAGIETNIECKKLATSGTAQNVEGTPMKGTSAETLTFSECGITKPEGKSCVIKEGKITTNALTNETIVGETEAKTGVRFVPTSGTTLFALTIEKCTVTALNGTFSATGEFVGKVTGTTLTFNQSNTKGLKFGGNQASLTGTVTVSGRKKGGSEAFAGLSLTTTSS